MSFDFAQLESDVALGADVATALAPVLSLIPGIGPYVSAITAAIPEIVKATQAVEAAMGSPVGTAENANAVAAGIDPRNSATIPPLPSK